MTVDYVTLSAQIAFAVRALFDVIFYRIKNNDCETVIRRNGEEYQFVSNCYLGGSESGYGAGNSEVRAGYAALQNFLENSVLPDGTEVEFGVGILSEWHDIPDENIFCIADVGGDGKRE